MSNIASTGAADGAATASNNNNNHHSSGNNGNNNVERETFLEGVGKYENVRITKNVIVLGIAFMLHFTAFHGTANLQSSVNTDGDVGTYTLAAMYGSLILSNIFLPVAVISWLGCKWTIAVSFFAYMPFIAAQAYPQIYTLVPAGMFVGLGGGPLWCAKCTYLTVVAEAFAALLRGETKQDVLVVRFFGLFFIFYQMAQVWGNLISSTVLSSSIGLESWPTPENGSISETFDSDVTSNAAETNVAELCGARFCPGVSADDVANLQPPHPHKIQLLAAVFLALMLAAVGLVAFFADSLKRYEMGRKGAGSGLSGLRLLAVTVRHLMQWKQLLLVPITMFIGAEQAFIAVDFTASFVACGWGISRIGYVMIVFGLANAIAAVIAGSLAKCLGRIPLMAGTLVVHLGLLIWMRLWIAVANDYGTYFAMAGIWGLVDGVWLVLVNSYYGILFTGGEEAAFSNFRLLEATGSVIAYVLSPVLCTGTKLVILMVLMVIGMAGFVSVEWRWRKETLAQGVELRTNKSADAAAYAE